MFTATGTVASTFPFASTTAITSVTASTTNFFGAGINTCNSGNVLTWATGKFGCAADQTAAGAANAFTWSNNFGVVAAATSSAIWAQNGLFSSSTIQTTGVNVDRSGSYQQAGVTILYSSTTNSSTLVGPTQAVLQGGALGNFFAGFQSGKNATSSSYNVAIGYQALTGGSLDSSGTYNVALGYQALTANTLGVSNIAISSGSAGLAALPINTTGSYNVALGRGALLSNVSGSNNLAIGNLACSGATADSNICLGGAAGASGIGASTLNVVVGVGSMESAAQTGGGNIAIGSAILNALTSGTSNIGIGSSQTLVSNTTGTTTTLFSISNTGAVSIGSTATTTAGGGIDISSGCYAINGACIGYTVKLAAIYATSTAGTTTVAFTGAQGSAPSFSAATLTLPSNTSYYTVEVWGGGGGGGAINTNNGGTGASTCYSNNAIACASVLLKATGGTGGANASGAGGTGGTGSGGDLNETGGAGASGNSGANMAGGGGSAPFGGAGAPNNTGTTGGAGQAFGGGGSGANGNPSPGSGGGGGGYSRKLITNKTSATFVVGAGGAGGSGTPTGGDGGAGGVVIMVYATSSANAAGNDYAEMFPVNNPTINAGDIVAVDNATPISMKLAQAGDAALAGIVATNPGQVLGDINAAGQRPIALSGRVPAKVNLEGGEIHPGDRIALSSVAGVGKKATQYEDSVGIALDSYTANSTGGTVMVFVTLARGMSADAMSDLLLGPAQVSVTSSASTTPATTSTTTTALATTTTATSSTTPFTFSTTFVSRLAGMFTSWFASAGNGIMDFFATTIHAENVYAKNIHAEDTICIGEQCLTKDDVSALLQVVHGAGWSSSTSTPPTQQIPPTEPAPTPDATSTPPTTPTPTEPEATSTPPVVISDPTPTSTPPVEPVVESPAPDTTTTPPVE
jgi:hypothetical protein